jgi:hypothetical protein
MAAAIPAQLKNDIDGMWRSCSREIMAIDSDNSNTIQLAIEDSNTTSPLGKFALDITPTAYEALMEA